MKLFIVGCIVLLGLSVFATQSLALAQADLSLNNTPLLLAQDSLLDLAINLTNTGDENLSEVTLTFNNSQGLLLFNQSIPEPNSSTSTYALWNLSLLQPQQYTIVELTVFASQQGEETIIFTLDGQSSSGDLHTQTNQTIMVADSYETDNTSSTASDIPVNATEQTRSIYPAGDRDYISFQAQQGTLYHVALTDVYGSIYDLNPSLRVYDVDGESSLAYVDDVLTPYFKRPQIYWKAPATDTYFIEVRDEEDENQGSYGIFVEELSDINLSFVDLPSAKLVQKNNLFNISVNVSCGGIGCTNLSVFLDPQPHTGLPRSASPSYKITTVPADISQELFTVTVLFNESNISSAQNETSFHTQETRSSLTKNEKRQKNIKRAQQAIAQEFFSTKGLGLMSSSQQKILRNYTAVGAMEVQVTAGQLEELMNNPLVEGIYDEPELHISTATSIPLIRADQVWSQELANTPLQGAHQTVCIVDSGIDYTHDDFGAGTFPNAKILGGYDFVNDDANPLDDQGHGTHIAGTIASQDATYTGVAPQAQIVAVKACNSEGSCGSAEVLAGIDWCLAHASEYNISVISLSLGGSESPFQTYCSGPLPSAINYARDQGIFVAVAAGNDGWVNGVSYPACARGAFTVSSIDKDDSTIRYNRGNLTDILAPGYNIVASRLGGGHTSKSGTSMATPHAAGAALLLNQYYQLYDGLQLHAQRITQALTSTGPQRYDAGSDMNFPRLDVFNAYDSFSIAKGIISTTQGDTPFYTIDSNPQNVTLAAGNWSILNWTVNATGEYGAYDFFAFVGDTTNTSELRTSTRIVNITDATAPNVTALSPQNNTWNNTLDQDFLFSVADTIDDNFTCELFINDELNDTQTHLSSGQHHFTTSLSQGNYTWSVRCFDIMGNNGSSSSFDLFLDTQGPHISVADIITTQIISHTPVEIHLNISVQDAPLQEPIIAHYGEIEQEILPLTYPLYNFSFTPNKSTTYDIIFEATDQALNTVEQALSLPVGLQETQAVNSTTTRQQQRFEGVRAVLETQLANTTSGNATLTRYNSSPHYCNTTLPYSKSYMHIGLDTNISNELNWAQLKINYTAEEIAGLQLDTIALFMYNRTNASWFRLNTSYDFVNATGHNQTASYLWINTTHFSTYAFTGNQVICADNSAVVSSGCYYNEQLYTTGYICSGQHSSTSCTSTLPGGGGGSSGDGGSSGSGSSGGGFALSTPSPTNSTNTSDEENTTQQQSNSSNNLQALIDSQTLAKPIMPVIPSQPEPPSFFEREVVQKTLVVAAYILGTLLLIFLLAIISFRRKTHRMFGS